MFEVEGKDAASVMEVRVRIGVVILAMAFSVIWGLVSFYWFVGDDPATWFGRSGAVITVLALLSEAQLSEGTGRLNNAMSTKYKATFTIWRAVALVSAVIGTLIWGYGDMLYCDVRVCMPKS